MGLKADTEKVATLIFGLVFFGHSPFWSFRKQCLFNYTPKEKVAGWSLLKALKEHNADNIKLGSN